MYYFCNVPTFRSRKYTCAEDTLSTWNLKIMEDNLMIGPDVRMHKNNARLTVIHLIGPIYMNLAVVP